MELTTNQFAVMNMRFTMISGLLPLIGNKKALSAAIKRTAAEYGISKPTVRKYLNLYLEAQDKTVLAPEIRKKETPENEYAADIRWALNKYYYCRDKLSLSEVYTLLIKERFYKDGSLVESRPTYGQFLYYYNKHKSTSNKIITREGLSYYQRNERPLLGDGVQSYASAPGVGMLDSTICDIYIINESGQLIGRPMLTICVDAFSSMLMGYSLGWEGGTFSLRNLMQNIITDKVEHCRSFGIELDEADWNCKDVLSGRFMTDKGAEYASENFSQITELGIQVENLRAYRAELKGTVEKAFDIIQDYFKAHLKGQGIIEPDFQERGAPDYRRQACLTLRQFEAILLNCIIQYNAGRVIDNFPYSQEMLADKVKPYAADIWNWGITNSVGINLVKVSAEKLRLTLLPRTSAKFTRRGLMVNKLRYKATGFRDEYLDGKTGEAAYDPYDVGKVWLVDKDSGFIEFDLIESRFASLSIEAVEEMKEQQKQLIKQEKETALLSRIMLADAVETIAQPSNNGNLLTLDNVKNVRKTRQIERERRH